MKAIYLASSCPYHKDPVNIKAGLLASFLFFSVKENKSRFNSFKNYFK